MSSTELEQLLDEAIADAQSRAAHGHGLTPKQLDQLQAARVAVATSTLWNGVQTKQLVEQFFERRQRKIGGQRLRIEEAVQVANDRALSSFVSSGGFDINPLQARMLTAPVLALFELYQFGIRQLFVSYMTEDVLTGEPPSWGDICQNQLQLEPKDAETCCCALRVCPDLVAHREFKVFLLDVSPVSGSLLFPQFVDLLWRCAAASPLARSTRRYRRAPWWRRRIPPHRRRSSQS